MSTIKENLDRIKNAKSAIKNAIIQKGIEVTDTERIETYADKILQIKTGGGTTEIPEFDPNGPLTFYRLDDIGDSYVSLGPNALPNIEYSTDKTTWKTYTSKQKIKLGKGEYVQFKYKNGNATTDNNRFNIDGGLYNLYGLFTTLGKINKTTYYQNMFSYLPIIDASNLTLGDTNITYDSSGNCAYMFQNCIMLTGLPKITTKIVTNSCYMFMFDGCASLKSIPNNYLPTPNEVKDNMYESMFSGCTGLTTLPSNLITFNKYRSQGQYLCKDMFNGCTGLTTLPSGLLPATTLASYCYQYMFSNCTGLTTLPKLPATTLASYCYQYMFNSCTSLVETQDGWYLPNVTTLASQCYHNMFAYCYNLQKMAVAYSSGKASNSWGSPWYNWMYSVSKTGTFYYSKNQTKENIQSIVPSGWTLVQSSSW